MTGIRTALDVVRHHAAPLGGRRILDLGCGQGGLAADLRAAGADWTGADPFPPEGAEPAIVRAPAQALPFGKGAFETVLFVNSLHHVPVPTMPRALREAARVLAPGGRIVVIEPLAEGALSQVLAVIDDETAIRAAAQAAIGAALAEGWLIADESYRYDRRESFDGYADFAAEALAVDAARAAALKARRVAFEAAFAAHAESGADGRPSLRQPMQVHCLCQAPAAARSI